MPPRSGWFSGEGADVLSGELESSSEEVADLAGSDADVAGGDVGVGPAVAGVLVHEGVAEAHDLCGGGALGVEVGAALAAADREAGEGVLEALLEGEEAEGVLVDRGVEAEAALVGAEGVVVLDAPGGVGADDAVVVDPADGEADDAVGGSEAVEDGPAFGVAVRGESSMSATTSLNAWVKSGASALLASSVSGMVASCWCGVFIVGGGGAGAGNPEKAVEAGLLAIRLR